MVISDIDLVLRLALTTVLCLVVGLERETHDRAAGLRTHALVGMGAALFTLVSAYGFENFLAAQGPQNATRFVDPTRIAAQIVSGIGFLGAGVIIKQGATIRGVTTAASLWCVAAIGMAIGAGFYVGGIATTALAIICLYVLRKMRPKFITRIKPNRGLLTVTVDKAHSIGEVLNVLHRYNIQIKSVEEQDEGADDEIIEFIFSLKQDPSQAITIPYDELHSIKGVRTISFSEGRFI